MAAQVWLEVHQRTLVVRKHFGPESSKHYRAEQAWLRQANGHPVVSVHSAVCSSDGSSILTTDFAGSATAVSAARPPDEAAQLLGASARALGGLHGHGLIHGNLTGDHIVVDGPRFVFCSPSGLDHEPASDVAAFGPIIELLCHRWENEAHHRPDVIAAWRELGGVAGEATLSAKRLGARLEALPLRPRPRWWRRSANQQRRYE